MARPIKKGLDFFPLDVRFFENRKISRLRRKHGSDGALLFIKLLCMIYENGYFVSVDNDLSFDLSEQAHLTEEKVLEIIDDIVALGLFNKALFTKNKVLTSKTIQENYLFAKKHVLKNQVISKDLDLVSDPKPGVSGEKSTHRIVYNSIEKNSRLIEIKNLIIIFIREEKFLNLDKDGNVIETGVTTSSGSGDKESRFDTVRKEFRKELINDDQWLYSVVDTSGKSIDILKLLPEIIPLFENHIISTGETETLNSLRNYKYRFMNWWRCMKFQSASEIRKRFEVKHSDRRYNGRIQTFEDKERFVERVQQRVLDMQNEVDDL